MVNHSYPTNSNGEDPAFRQPPRFFLVGGRRAAWLVLALSLVITLWATQTARNGLDRVLQERFNFQVTEIRSAITERMQTYQQVLRGAVGLFNASEQVSREEWRVYVESLDLQKHYPGILGIGYARWLEPAEVEAHVQTVRDQGFPDYRVWPEGKRQAYSSIVYLEPFSWRNRRAFGYDMYSEPVRRNAMERARDSGRVAVSGRITLVQETERDVQAGFLVYLPLYESRLPRETPAQRRDALRGWVYSPFRMDDLMTGILGRENQQVHLKIYDGEQVVPENAMYDSNPKPDTAPPSAFTLGTVPQWIWTAIAGH
ncbi:MAG: CHASE domain-containing protein [Candidatus Competibacteraceae bacterium]|nr:CHASE domain-containing protein [Candidatus Competibacteraceae bacterium]